MTSHEHDRAARPTWADAISLTLPFLLQACAAAPSASPLAATSAGGNAATASSPSGAADPSWLAGARDAAGPVVRVSLGWYPVEHEQAVASLLDYAKRSIGADITGLSGLVWYHSGIDREHHAIVNVSLWRDVAAAQQMSRLQAMLDLGGEMTRLGVQFVRPIANSEPIWTATAP
jgi:hypothetical protein